MSGAIPNWRDVSASGRLTRWLVFLARKKLALSALRRSALGMTGIVPLTDGSEAPLQGSFRSAPGFLPVVSTPSCQRLCALQTTCSGYKRGRMSREKLSPLRPIAVAVLAVEISLHTIRIVRAAEPYTPPFAEANQREGYTAINRVGMSRAEWKKARKPVGNPGPSSKPFSSLPMPHGPCF